MGREAFKRRARSGSSGVGFAGMTRVRLFGACALLLLLVGTSAAEVVRVDLRPRDDFGTHERIVCRVHFAIEPADRANAGIADVALAPRNAAGRVEFSSDLLFFMPNRDDVARGTVFLEILNLGRDQSL